MTVRQIAESLGVSPATVSLVLNQKPGVRPELRDKITEALIQNGYTLKEKTSVRRQDDVKRILFVYYQNTSWLGSRNDNFMSRIIDGVERGCKSYGCTFTIAAVGNDNIREVINKAQKDNTDGIIFLCSEFDIERYDYFTDVSLPIVCIDRYMDEASVNSIHMDSYTGNAQSIDHLYELGHRKIGYITTSSPSGSIPQRERTFYEIMEKKGLSVDKNHIVEVGFLVDEVQKEFIRYLKETPSLPTAFMTANDVLATAVIHGLYEKGYKVPDDISIVGFDDSVLCSIIVPPLTTIRGEIEQMSETAVFRINQLVKNELPGIMKINIGSSLIVRGSTGPVKKNKRG